GREGKPHRAGADATPTPEPAADAAAAEAAGRKGAAAAAEGAAEGAADTEPGTTSLLHLAGPAVQEATDELGGRHHQQVQWSHQPLHEGSLQTLHSHHPQSQQHPHYLRYLRLHLHQNHLSCPPCRGTATQS
ncbi:unnamed protein product, partial [Closterium sp. NIES-53]